MAVERGLSNIFPERSICGGSSRYHGNSEYKVPWLYGDEAVAVTRKFTRLKLSLMPYLFAAAVEASAEIYASSGLTGAGVQAVLHEGRITVTMQGFTGICRLFLSNLFQIKESSRFTTEHTEWGTQIDFEGEKLEIDLL